MGLPGTRASHLIYPRGFRLAWQAQARYLLKKYECKQSAGCAVLHSSKGPSYTYSYLIHSLSPLASLFIDEKTDGKSGGCGTACASRRGRAQARSPDAWFVFFSHLHTVRL